MGVLSNLEPKKVFHYFEEICGIPHGSYNEKAISNYLVEYAKEHGFEYAQDELYNVLMWIPASEGYEEEEPIILQGHMDMVCEKKPGVTLDMETESIQLVVEGDYVRAKDTTLGGDDGIAIAYMLAVADDKTISHPPLEYIITVSEEVGMEGAAGIDLSKLKGNRMLNIDSEEEGIFLTSCAGGVSAHVTIPVSWDTTSDKQWYEIVVSGLLGGHSGVEIHKERANSNKVLGRVLAELDVIESLVLSVMEGGAKDNAIPLYARAVIGLDAKDADKVRKQIEEIGNVLKMEYAVSDPDIVVSMNEMDNAEVTTKVVSKESLSNLVTFLMTAPDGVQNMSVSVPGLVETSLNMGIMKLTQEHLFTQHAIRSSVTTKKHHVVNQMKRLAETFGGTVECKGEYPAWEYKNESEVRDRIIALYEKTYGKQPKMEGIHAGLECGLLASKIANLDCVSMGPDILDIHTPTERLSISSTKRVYEFLLAFLAQK